MNTTDAPLPPPPSGTGCVECLENGGWWWHLRRCVECGHVGCCDSSPEQHANRHAHATGHAVAASFEPGENWFWDYLADTSAKRIPLSPPLSRPDDQPSPGPEGKVPPNWRDLVLSD